MQQEQQAYTEEEARDKNREEYDQAAGAYDEWAKENVLMQHYCYFSTVDQAVKNGVEGKTFLEVGCGPCPIGQQLAERNAKKIYGLDISEEMIENARKDLTDKGLIEKFELVAADIFDQSFQLPEKVDCVILSYAMTTFINDYKMLVDILSQCRKQINEDGYILLVDFEHVSIPNENFWAGMYTQTLDGKKPQAFNTFDFIIDKAPNHIFKIFHIPSDIIFKASYEAGFKNINYQPQYPDPEYEKNEVMRRYLDTMNPTDYIFKMSN